VTMKRACDPDGGKNKAGAMGEPADTTASNGADFLRLLAPLRASCLCLADWAVALRGDLGRIRPLLLKCMGRMTKSYPDPGSGLRLTVEARGAGFLAFPVGDFDLDAEDLALTETEVQLWRLDWGKTTRAFPELLECGRLGEGISLEELRGVMADGFKDIKRERIEDLLKAKQQSAAIEEMALPPDQFLAGLSAKLKAEERILFFDLIAKIEEGGKKRFLTYAEIAMKQKGRGQNRGVTRQAIGSRVKRLFAKNSSLRKYVEALRKPAKEEVFSEKSPSWRRKMGVEESYGYDAK
jgi:hypothetical protein